MSNERVLTCGFSRDLIVELADYLCREGADRRGDLSRFAVVFGGRRPALFLNRELARRAGKSFFPPRYYSIDEFMTAAAGAKRRPVISDMDASYAVYTLARKRLPDLLRGRESFSRLLPWAREILAFIEQLDLEDIPFGELRNVQSKARIGYDVPENINVLLGHVIGLRKAYHAFLDERGCTSRGYTYLRAASSADDGALCAFERIVFCGFFYLHATEQAVMKRLHDAGRAVFMFQGSRHEWPSLEKASRALGIDIVPAEHEAVAEAAGRDSTRAGAAGPDISICSGFDLHSQVCMVREIVKRIPRGEKAVLVVPDPENVVPLLSELPSATAEFNVSMGYPLRRSSLYSLFLSLFKAQSSRKDGSYYSRDYLEVLSHPLVKNLRIAGNAAVTRVLTHKLEEILSGMEKTELSGRLFIRLQDVEHSRELVDAAMNTVKAMELEASRDELVSIVRFLHRLLFSSWETANTFAGFAGVLGDFLDTAAERSPLGSYPLNVRMSAKLADIKDEFSAASFSSEPFKPGEIFRVFQQRIERELVSFSGSPLKGLQVLGLLETRSLHFDHVVVMDANEQVLPKLQIYEPLIPREVMISLGLNRLEKEEEIQRYQFHRLIAGARTAHIVYQQRPDKEKSRFIEEIIWKKQKEQRRLDVGAVQGARFNVRVLPKRMSIAKDERMLGFLKGLTLSASSINTYLDCPLRFYYQYVLGLREKDDVLDELEGADVGTFVHELLEETFAPFIGKRPVIDGAFRKAFFKRLDEKFSCGLERSMKSDAFLLKEVLNVRLEAFLDNEQKRGVSRLLCLEREFRGTISSPAGDFACKARIDRIDVSQDNTVLVVDYKTGGSDILPDADQARIEAAGYSRESLKKTVKSFQLPLYLHLVDRSGDFTGRQTNAALYSLRDVGASREGTALKPLLRKPEQLARKSELMRTYLDALGALLVELVNPAVAFQADEGDGRHCVYCPFFYLCR